MKNIFLAITGLCLVFSQALAAEKYSVTIKDHHFSPAEISVPAGKKIKLVISNEDASPEEFESHDLNREKLIAAKGKGIVFIGPLKPGTYHYFGEFNPKTAQGSIIVK